MGEKRYYAAMHNIKRLLTVVFALVMAQSATASYYETLPKNVRMMALGWVNTGTIKSSFGTNRDQFDYFIRQDLNASSVADAHPALRAYFDELKRIDPAAYDAFSFGEYEGSGEANVDVKGLGFAYGVTNHLTLFTIVPLWDAQVRMNIQRTKGNNYAEVQQILSKHGNTNDTAFLMSQITANFPDANGGLLQSIIMNNFGYEPIGNWSGTGFGDVELGTLYRLTDELDMGLAVSGGVVLPTGRIDNPDILQDVPFGDGQFDIYAEAGGGITLFKGKLDLDTSLRYTYQLPSTKTLRIPEDEDFTLSANKGDFYEKLGNRITYMASSTWKWNDWFSTEARYDFEYQGQATYESQYTDANRILGINSDFETHMLGLGANLSTVTLYKKGIFAAPGFIDFKAKTMVNGRNTPKYSRYEFQIRLYF
jgi:hypothetical protein